jgi:hypothetical protein
VKLLSGKNKLSLITPRKLASERKHCRALVTRHGVWIHSLTLKTRIYKGLKCYH